jgi:hypothetical protein
LKSKKAVQKKARILRNYQFINEYKNTRTCTDCDKSYHSSVMEFDHIINDKRFNIADAVRNGLSIKALEAEILKCELVCANCHRLRTFLRREGLE